MCDVENLDDRVVFWITLNCNTLDISIGFLVAIPLIFSTC